MAGVLVGAAPSGIRLLNTIYERHAPVLLTMARGAYELRQKYKGNSDFYDLEGR